MKIYAIMIIVVTLVGGATWGVSYISGSAVARHELPRLVEAIKNKEKSTQSVLSQSEKARQDHEAEQAEMDKEITRLRAEAKLIKDSKIPAIENNPYCRKGCLIQEQS